MSRGVTALNLQWWEVARGSIVSKTGGRYGAGRWTVWSGVNAEIRHARTSGLWLEAQAGYFDLGPPAFWAAGLEAGWRFWWRRDGENLDHAAITVGVRSFGVPGTPDRAALRGESALTTGRNPLLVPVLSVVRVRHVTYRRDAFHHRAMIGFSPATGRPMILLENNASLVSLNWWYAPDVFGSAVVLGAGIGVRL